MSSLQEIRRIVKNAAAVTLVWSAGACCGVAFQSLSQLPASPPVQLSERGRRSGA